MVDRDDIAALITEEDVTDVLVNQFGSTPPTHTQRGELIFDCVCHGSCKRKLYYYPDSKTFHCYTECGTMSVFDFLMISKNMEFTESVKFWCKYKGIDYENKTKKRGLTMSYANSDLEFMRLHKYKPQKNQIVVLPSYDSNILTNGFFDDYLPSSWVEEEGISEEILELYGVKFWFEQYKGIIPHLDINGRLIGIKARNFLNSEVESGRKYIPVTIQKKTYRYPMRMNLYGLYYNKENIKKYKKVIIFESEKSVWKYATFKGQENNIAVAACGLNFSICQRDMLLNLDIEEVTFAYDKQYEIDKITELTDEEKEKSKEYKDYVKFILKIKKAASLFIRRVRVSVIFDWQEDGVNLYYKDAPIDNGEEVFDKLYGERYFIEDITDFDELIE